MAPKPVAAILESNVFLVFARIVLTTPFWAAGLQHALQFQPSLGEMTHFGLSPPALYVIATIITCLAGSALVIVGGKLTWVGAGWLGIFTFLTLPIAHAFWAMTGDAQMSEFRTAIEHVAIIGGMMVVAILEHKRTGSAGA